MGLRVVCPCQSGYCRVADRPICVPVFFHGLLAFPFPSSPICFCQLQLHIEIFTAQGSLKGKPHCVALLAWSNWRDLSNPRIHSTPVKLLCISRGLLRVWAPDSRGHHFPFVILQRPQPVPPQTSLYFPLFVYDVHPEVRVGLCYAIIHLTFDTVHHHVIDHFQRPGSLHQYETNGDELTLASSDLLRAKHRSNWGVLWTPLSFSSLFKSNFFHKVICY